jgi:hypothetical protein
MYIETVKAQFPLLKTPMPVDFVRDVSPPQLTLQAIQEGLLGWRGIYVQ